MIDATINWKQTTLPLVRMNGVGNAIVVLDARGSRFVPSADDVRAIARAPRLAFDQLMTIHDPQTAATEAYVRIFNRDGSPSAACGNGTRCVAWVLARGSGRDHLIIETAAGLLDCRRVSPFVFSVDMGAPVFAWSRIPLRNAACDPTALHLGVDDPQLAALGRPFALSMGNPHAVFFVAETEAIDLARLGPLVEHAPAFPEGANVSFAEIVDRNEIRLRVWERGAGATLGCGTGACASLVAAAATGRAGRHARVVLPGGPLDIAWRDDDHVVMTGAVELELETTLNDALLEDDAFPATGASPEWGR